MSVNVLGPTKLAALSRATGLSLDGALVYSHHNSGREAMARIVENGECLHVTIDRRTFEVVIDEEQVHWSTCIERRLVPA